MWGDLIFPISPFIMPKFADNLTITFLTETFICKTSINYKLFCLIEFLKIISSNCSDPARGGNGIPIYPIFFPQDTNIPKNHENRKICDTK